MTQQIENKAVLLSFLRDHPDWLLELVARTKHRGGQSWRVRSPDGLVSIPVRGTAVMSEKTLGTLFKNEHSTDPLVFRSYKYRP